MVTIKTAPTLADIDSDDWKDDGETFTYNGKLYRFNDDFTITEVNNDNDKE